MLSRWKGAMNIPLSIRSHTSVVCPEKRVDDKISEGDNSGTLATESDSNNDTLFDESVMDAAANELLESLKAMDGSRSVGSWKSETSIHFGSSSCTSTQSDFSASDSESAMDLEEALMKALFADNESVELPPELIIPYPDESGGCQGRPKPWDSSSSDGASSSSPMSQTLLKGGEISPRPTVACPDNQPLVPRRRRSNDALSNVHEERPPRRSTQLKESEPSNATPGDLHSFLMARLPSSIVSKLDANEWSQVCSEVTRFEQNNGEEATPEPGDVHQADCTNYETSLERLGTDDRTESYSVVSELTGATGLNNDHSCAVDSEAADDVSLLTFPETQSQKSSSNLKSRAWHDSSKCLSDAPVMPIRRGRYPMERTNSEPRVLPNAPRAFSRSSSLPCDLISVSRRRVSFDTVQVRHYEPVLDLNPSTSQGPSLGIGWNYFLDSPKKITDIEDEKDRLGRRSMREIIIPRHIREQTLKDCGYTTKDIAKAVRMNLKSKGQRMQTIHNYKIDQIVEKSSRKVRRLFNPSRYQSTST